MSVISRKFADELAEKAMRDAYLEAQTRTKLAQQIRALRVQRGWQQRELGHLMGKPQGNVARLEDREVARYTLTTLFELASAFDVGFIAKFVTYEDFLRDTDNLDEDALKVQSFNRNALRELCEDLISMNDISVWTNRHPELIPSGNTLVDFNAPIFSDTVVIGKPINIGHELPHGKSWAGIWNALRPISNSSIYQIRLPSAQDEELSRLRHALAQSEREKAILQKEYAALRAKVDAMTVHHTQEGILIPPAFMV